MEIGEMKGSVRIAMFRFIFDQKPRVNANSVLMENFGKEISKLFKKLLIFQMHRN